MSKPVPVYIAPGSTWKYLVDSHFAVPMCDRERVVWTMSPETWNDLLTKWTGHRPPILPGPTSPTMLLGKPVTFVEGPEDEDDGLLSREECLRILGGGEDVADSTT